MGPFGHKTENLQFGETEHTFPHSTYHCWYNNSLYVKKEQERDKEEQIGGKENEVNNDACQHSTTVVIQPVLRILLRTAQVLAHRKNMTVGVAKTKKRKITIKVDAEPHLCDTSQSRLAHRTQC